jgi:hypothetical protein
VDKGVALLERVDGIDDDLGLFVCWWLVVDVGLL